MKKFIKILVLITLVVTEISGRSHKLPREEKVINSTPDDELAEINPNENKPQASEDGDLEALEGTSNINPNPDHILPPDAERSINSKNQQSKLSLVSATPSNVKPHINGKLRIPQTIANIERTLAITNKCQESHDGIIFFPGEPRPIICDSFSSTTTRTTDRFTSSTSGPIGSSTKVPNKYEKCLTTCKISALHRPVCGTNFMTYFNADHINCARKCGDDVFLLHNRECDSSTSAPINSTPAVPTTSSKSPARFDQCLLSCSVTSEYHPVCGSDSVTYSNPSKLLCAKKCGKNVNEMRKGSCSSKATSTTTTTSPTIKPVTRTTQAPIVTTVVLPEKECDCITNMEYDPVCGTNLVTYSNSAKLYCDQSCGVDVSIARQGRCDEDEEQNE